MAFNVNQVRISFNSQSIWLESQTSIRLLQASLHYKQILSMGEFSIANAIYFEL